MDTDELDKLIAETQKRALFKKQRGWVPNIVKDGKIVPKPKKKVSPTVNEKTIDAIIKQRQADGTLTKNIQNQVMAAKENSKGLTDLVTIPSEALRAINADSIGTALRNVEIVAKRNTNKAEKTLSTIMDRLGLVRTRKNLRKKPVMTPRDTARLDIAMRNGHIITPVSYTHLTLPTKRIV